MIQRLHRLGAAAALTLGATVLAPLAFAQTPPPTQEQAPTQQAPTQAAPNPGPAPTNEELVDFAHAATDVVNIRKSTEPKLQAAKSDDARTKLQQAAEKQMEAAVRNNHLSVQRYEQIAMVVQTNAEVRQKVLQIMQNPAKS